MKPSIRKQDGSWTVTRPGFGFTSEPSVKEFPSWREAITSLRSGPGSAGAIVERGTEPRPGLWYRSARDAKGPVPIRMEET